MNFFLTKERVFKKNQFPGGLINKVQGYLDRISRSTALYTDSIEYTNSSLHPLF